MTPHIEANKGDYAETVLLPGDPLRAKWIAETFFENPVQVNSVRNCLGYTGTYANKKFPYKQAVWECLATQFTLQNCLKIMVCKT